MRPGLIYAQHDVSGFGQAVQNFINGQMKAPVTVKGYLTTTADIETHPVINGAYAVGSQVTLTVQVGQNAAPTSGDPEFEGEFVVAHLFPSLC